jgi:hypothetical protein
MPLALQAILPLVILLLAALLVLLRRGQSNNGWIAAVATAVAALVGLIELVRLAPGEHVDVPYLTTFPYADLLIRLDGLSLAFVSVTLITAALLMLVRQWDGSDRRDPWTGWLLTTAAASALMLAGNLLLLYILLQLLTLAWSGAIDETAPRRRRLRLTMQIADIGLLLAAASAIQSVGTSSFSGVPSDTFGVASFWLMMLPVGVRIGAVAAGVRRPLTAVAFAPSVVWLAPAGYILMRLLGLMGGRLPDRPTAVLLFGLAAAAAIALTLLALGGPAERMSSLLLAAQAGVALALSSGSEPLLTIAGTWMWLLLVPVAGLASLRTAAEPAAELLARLQLSMLPGSLAFTGIWLAVLTLNALGLILGTIPLLLAVLLAVLTALRALPRPAAIRLHPMTIWGAALLLIGALPLVAFNPLVFPAATAVRLLPAGTASAGPLGVDTALGTWPALPVFIAVAALLVAGGWFSSGLIRRGALRAAAMGASLERIPTNRVDRLRVGTVTAAVNRLTRGWWPRIVLWGSFTIVVIVSLARP